MQGYALKRRFTQQPQYAAPIDRSNKFGKWVISGVQGGVPFASVDGRALSRTAGADAAAGVVKFDGSAGNRIEYGVVQPSGEFSIAAKLRKTTAHANNCSVFDNKIDADWGNNVGFEANIKDDHGFMFKVGTSETYYGNGPFGDAKFHRVSTIFSPGSVQDIYVDGVKPSYAASAVAAGYNSVSRSLVTGAYYDRAAVRSGASEIEYAILFGKGFSSVELEEFHRNPWQIFAAANQPLFAAATGGTTDHSLTATGITTSTPTLTSPAISQNHALTGSAIATAAAAITLPAIGQNHSLTASSIATSAATVSQPTISGDTYNLIATAIATAAGTLGTPALSQNHALTGGAIAAGAPVFGTPTLAQQHAMMAEGITTGTPTLGTPALTSGIPSTGSISDEDIARIAAAVLAAMNLTPPAVNAEFMNGAEIIGDGTEGNPWRGVGVQP